MIRVLLVAACMMCAGGHDPAASSSPGGIADERALLTRWLLDGGIRALDPGSCPLIVEKIPDSLRHRLLSLCGPECLDVGIECVALDSSAFPFPSGVTDQVLCVVTDGQELSYVGVTERVAGVWGIVWDTILGEIPQPSVGFPTLGLEGDSSVVIGLRGLVSPSGYQSYDYLLWTGTRAHLLGGAGGLWVEEKDINGDGVAEILATDHRRSAAKPMDSLAQSIYSFDAKSGRYHRAIDSKSKPR
ncbi:MAG TPA: hypothetical protein VNN55_10710 [bacterium]|nr:hypothetical protein [bacterium]